MNNPTSEVTCRTAFAASSLGQSVDETTAGRVAMKEIALTFFLTSPGIRQANSRTCERFFLQH